MIQNISNLASIQNWLLFFFEFFFFLSLNKQGDLLKQHINQFYFVR